MELLKLPINTQVNRIIPKNTFDSYTNTRQKKLFTDKVLRIMWLHKLSKLTTNLPSKDIQEIQVFRIELKACEAIPQILNIIDKAIPYPIIFLVQCGEKVYCATSVKHPHPTNENNSVVDWTFTSDWMEATKFSLKLNLKGSIDEAHKDFCLQLSGRYDLKKKSIDQIVKFQQEKQALESEIGKLKQQISRSKRFKEKVELNLRLKEKEKELNFYLSN
jgi:hypothetical protein